MKADRWTAAGLALVLGLVVNARAETAATMQRAYEIEVRKTQPAFAGFSAPRGEQIFKSRHGSDWSCASCHTDNPAMPGKHAKTGKAIAPLAPSANAERFTDLDKTEKWFRRNCNDVVARNCSAIEKGDVLAYLLSLKK